MARLLGHTVFAYFQFFILGVICCRVTVQQLMNKFQLFEVSMFVCSCYPIEILNKTNKYLDRMNPKDTMQKINVDIKTLLTWKRMSLHMKSWSRLEDYPRMDNRVISNKAKALPEAKQWFASKYIVDSSLLICLLLQFAKKKMFINWSQIKMSDSLDYSGLTWNIIQCLQRFPIPQISNW